MTYKIHILVVIECQRKIMDAWKKPEAIEHVDPRIKMKTRLDTPTFDSSHLSTPYF